MSPLYPDLASVSEELFDKVVAVNLKGPFRLTALVGARMAAGDGGSIINVSSVAAVRPTPNELPYGAAKAGLDTLTIGFAMAYGPKVRVNSIQCGPFLTDIADAWDQRSRHQAVRAPIPSAGPATRGRSSGPPSTSPATPPASPPAPSCASTAARPSPTDAGAVATFGFHTVHFSPMFGADAPLLDVINATADAGFDAIGIDLPSVDAHGSVETVAAVVADRGLRCSDVLVLVADADDALLAARRLASLAAALGAPTCIAAVAAPTPMDRLVATLGVCAAILGDHGSRLAIEFNAYGGLTSIGQAIELADAIGWDRAGVVIDSLHFFRTGAPWAALASLTAEQVAAVQWSDAPAEAPADLVHESRHRRLLPGDGGLDLRSLAAALRAIGWDGVVSAEILSDRLRGMAPAEAVPVVHGALTSLSAGWC